MNAPCFRPRLLLAVLALFCAGHLGVQAQWATQSVTLKPGWNAVFLHVDASYARLDDLALVAGNPIKEVWLWNPPSKSQFVNPQEPLAPNSQWAVWNRNAGPDNSLGRLIGNAAYLVNNTNTVNFVWNITGIPVLPRYQWNTSGLNFIGFPTPPDAAPRFSRFLAPVPGFLDTAELHRYVGGNLASGANPLKVSGAVPLYNTFANRGEAFWIRSTDPTYYNRYYGPFEVNPQDPSGADFGTRSGAYSIRLKNLTATATTVTLRLVASAERPSTNQLAIYGAPPLLVRGAMDITNRTYGYTVLSNTAPATFALAPAGQTGSEIQVVLGLNRSALTGPAGSFYAAILRFTDAGGLSQVDMPVTATVATRSGLWVGDAQVTQVAQYLKTYQLDSNGNHVMAGVTTQGAPYVATGTATNLGPVSKPLPLRLILHHDGSNTVNLLQRVYLGTGYDTNLVVATSEARLDPANLAHARRLSAAHLPFALTNRPWPKVAGAFQLGGSIEFDVPLDHNDQASNPFLHTFHPDHDNLKADFKTVEAVGVESYGVNRHVTLRFTALAGDFSSLTTGTDTLAGDYAETITFTGRAAATRSFRLAGQFLLKNIVPLAPLTTD